MSVPHICPGDLFSVRAEHSVLYGLDYAVSPVEVASDRVFLALSADPPKGVYRRIYTFSVDVGLRFVMAYQCVRIGYDVGGP